MEVINLKKRSLITPQSTLSFKQCPKIKLYVLANE